MTQPPDFWSWPWLSLDPYILLWGPFGFPAATLKEGLCWLPPGPCSSLLPGLCFHPSWFPHSYENTAHRTLVPVTVLLQRTRMCCLPCRGSVTQPRLGPAGPQDDLHLLCASGSRQAHIVLHRVQLRVLAPQWRRRWRHGFYSWSAQDRYPRKEVQNSDATVSLILLVPSATFFA